MPIPDLSNKPGPGRPGWPGDTGTYEFQFEVTDNVTFKAIANSAGTFSISYPDGTTTTTSGSSSITSQGGAGIISINKEEGDTTFCDEFEIVSNKDKVIKVISWGSNNWSSMANAFKDCTNLTELPPASNVFKAGSASLSQFIHSCTGLTELDMTGWDLSSGTGTNIFHFAFGCTNLEKVIFKNKDVKLNIATPRPFQGVGTSVSTGCEFDMEGLNFTGTCDNMNTWFITARAKVGSNFSNWRFNQSVNNLTLNSLFNQLKFVDTSAVLNISGWTDCNAIDLSSMFSGAGGTSAAPIDAINITGLRTNDTTTMYRMFRQAKMSRIIGLNDLVSDSLTSTGATEMFSYTERLLLKDPSVTPAENLSNSFGSNWSITSVSSMFERLNEQGNNYNEWSYPPNLTGFDLSGVTNFANFTVYNRLSNPYDLSPVTFPTSAISLQGSFSHQSFPPTSDFIFDFTNVTINVSNFQTTFQSNQCNRYRFGSNVNFSNNTTFQQTFKYSGMPPLLTNGNPSYRQIRVEFPTNANFGSVTTMNKMFEGQYGGYSNEVPFTNCQADNFIRIIHGTAFSNNLTIDLLNSQVTEAPSVVQSKLQELTTGTGGWSIEVNTTDATMPFVYTGPFQTGTNITPTINTSGGKFSSNDVTVDEDTGVFNTSTAVNATIRYTITATGCYNEQVLNVVPPFTPFKFRVTGPISIKAQPAVAGQSFTIDWGDGSAPVSTTGGTSIASNFTTAGTYDVQINAQGDNTYCDEFAIVSGQTNVTKVLDWGEKPWRKMTDAFSGCTSLSDISTTSFISSSAQAPGQNNMVTMFNGCTSLIEADIRNWDLTAGVNWYQGSPFKGLANLQKLDMTGLNVKFINRSDDAFKDIGTATTDGCEFLMSGCNWSTSTNTGTYYWFRNSKIKPTSDLSNWVFPTAGWVGTYTFRDVELTGTNPVLNCSGWSTYSASVLTGFAQQFNSGNNNGAKINITGMNVSNVTTMTSFANGSNLAGIIGLSTLGATAGNVSFNSAFQNCTYFKFDDNFSNAFIASLNPTSVANAFNGFGLNLPVDTAGPAINLTNLNLSNISTFDGVFVRAHFSDVPDFSTVTFPTSAISFKNAFNGMDINSTSSNRTMDFTNITLKSNNFEGAFNGADFDTLILGNNVDFSSVTTVQSMFYYTGITDIKLPTNINLSSLTNAGTMFIGAPTISTCQVDNLIRSFRDTAYSNNLTFDFYNAKVTGAPSVVRAKLDELTSTGGGGWNITVPSPDATIPFEYTGSLAPNTPITPTNNTGSAFTGTFTSSNSNIAVNSTTGVINSPNGGSTTIRYTLADGCYTEQAIELVSAEFSYSASAYCQNATDPTPTITGTSGGTFTAAEKFFPFQMQFDTSGGKTITIPGTVGSSFTVDWGDGNTTTETGGTISHTYDSGIATSIVSIGAQGDTGPFTTFSFAGTGSKSDLLDVQQWGSIVWTSFYRMFRGCNNTSFNQISATDNPISDNVSTMQGMFREATYFNSDVSGFNVDSLTTTENMFLLSAFNNGDLGNNSLKPLSWDFTNNTTGLSNISNMFPVSFNQDISSLKLGSINLTLAFYNLSIFNNGGQSLNSWDTSGVTSFYRTFRESAFNQNIHSWDVSSATSFQGMFRQTTPFSQNLSDWYTNGFKSSLSINAMASMFYLTSMTSEQFTDTIVGWAVAVHRDSAPYNVNAATSATSPPNVSFDATRTQDTDNSGNSVDYSTKYGSDWPSNPAGENWTNAGDARQFLVNNGWSVN